MSKQLKPLTKEVSKMSKAEKNSVDKKTDPSKSNKAIVYLAWKSKGITDPDKLLKLVENRVKESTVRTWVSAWKRGDKNFLPAIAKVKSK